MGDKNSNRTTIVDLSHTIEDGMITYKGLPGPIITDHLSREDSRKNYREKAEFHIGQIEMVANTGTYIDSPFHRHKNGNDLSKMPINSIVNLDGVLVHLPERHGRIVTEEIFWGRNLQGKAVLVHTGWDKLWGTDDYFDEHPFLTSAAAEYLKEEGAALVGIDSLNIDDTQDNFRPVHTILLGANIPIIEHMTNLNQLPEERFKLFVAPPKIQGLGSFPVRVFAIIT
jgi:kynurenine formamidase